MRISYYVQYIFRVFYYLCRLSAYWIYSFLVFLTKPGAGIIIRFIGLSILVYYWNDINESEIGTWIVERSKSAYSEHAPAVDDATIEQNAPSTTTWVVLYLIAALLLYWFVVPGRKWVKYIVISASYYTAYIYWQDIIESPDAEALAELSMQGVREILALDLGVDLEATFDLPGVWIALYALLAYLAVHMLAWLVRPAIGALPSISRPSFPVFFLAPRAHRIPTVRARVAVPRLSFRQEKRLEEKLADAMPAHVQALLAAASEPALPERIPEPQDAEIVVPEASEAPEHPLPEDEIIYPQRPGS